MPKEEGEREREARSAVSHVRRATPTFFLYSHTDARITLHIFILRPTAGIASVVPRNFTKQIFIDLRLDSLFDV